METHCLTVFPKLVIFLRPLSLKGAVFAWCLLLAQLTWAQCVITVDAGEDQFVCASPGQVTLNGSIAGDYLNFSWMPTAGMTGSTTLTPTVNVFQTATYILKAKAADYGMNAVDNGDFEQGNTGFWTDYNYNPNFSGYPFGSYDVAPFAVPLTHCPDHTSGSGNYLCVDGAEFPNEMVWCQTVTVTPNTEYLLSAWVTSINSVPLFANLEFTIDGVQVGSNFGAPPQCVWSQFTGIWNSGPNSSVTICIEDLTVTGANNDFGIDDIGLYPICMDADTVKVNVVSLTAVANPSVGLLPCDGANFTLNGTGSSTGPQISYQWDTPDGNIVSGGNTLQPVVNAAGTYTLTVTYDFGNGECTKTATATVIETPNPLSTWINPPPTLGCGSNQIVLNGFSNQGTVNYAWSTPDGNIVSGATSQNAIVNQPGVYNLLVTNFITGCTATATVTVQSGNNPPTAVAAVLDTITCAQTQATLSGAGSTTGAGIVYSWTTPNGVVVSGQNAIQAVAGAPGTYFFTVNNTNSNCSATDTITVPANTALPQAGIAIPGPISCQVDTLLLSASVSPANAQPVWTASGGGVIVAGDSSTTPLVTAAGIYQLTVTNPANGCSMSVQDTVLADLNPPLAFAQAPDTLSCQTAQVMLSGAGSSSGAAFVYQWTGGNVVSGGNTLSPLVDLSGIYTLLVTDTLNGCSADTTVFLAADTTFVIAQALSPDTLSCDNSVVTLDAGGSAGGVVFSWTTLSGQIDSGANTPTPTVALPGVYYLQVSNPVNGCNDTDSVLVIQDVATPLVQIQVPQPFTCTMLSQTLQAQVLSSGSFSFAWSATNGGTLISGNNTATPLIGSPGDYQLTVTNLANGCSVTAAVTATADQGTPIAVLGPAGTITCVTPNSVLDGSASSSGPGFAYQWTASGGGLILSGNNAPTAVAGAAGDYQLQVLNTANGCTATASVQVLADLQTPDAVLGAPAGITCLHPADTLSVANPVAGLLYQWQTLDGQIISGQNTPAIVLSAGGTYSLEVTNPVNGCTSASSVLVPENTLAPQIQVAAPALLTCALTTQTLDAQVMPAGNYDFAWTSANGTGIVSGSATAAPLIDAPGDYQVIVSNPANGCSSLQTVSVTADSLRPLAAIVSAGMITCATPQLTLDGNNSSSGSNITYLWTSPDGGTIISGNTSPDAVVSTEGTYLLQVTNTTNGCSAVTSVQITENVQVPDAAIVQPGLFTCLAATDTLFAANPLAGLVYQWQTLNGQMLAGQNTPALVIASAGNYALTVSNPINGCTAENTVQVQPDADTPVAAIAAADTITCAAASVVLNATASAGPAFTYAWTGSGLVSGVNGLAPVVDAPGVYTLLVTNTSNGCTAQTSVDVPANTTIPVVSIAAPAVLTCDVVITNLSAQPAGNGFTWQWIATNGGNILNGGTTASPAVNAPGAYQITVTDLQNGCTASASTTVSADQLAPVVNIASPPTLTCADLEVGLQGLVQSPLSGFSVQWSTQNGSIVNGANTTTPLVDAVGFYQMTVENQTNGCATTADVTVVADQTLPSANAGASANLTCTTTQLTLNGAASAGGAPFSVLWSGPAVLSGGNSFNPLIGAPGVYNLLVTNQINGCTASSPVSIGTDTVSPILLIQAPQILTCTQTTVTLDASASSQGPVYSYNWTTSDGHFMAFPAPLTPTVDQAGHYTLLIQNQQNGCESTAAVAVLQDLQPPVADAGPSQALHCHQTQVNLQGSSTTSGQLNYQWSATMGGQIISGAGTSTPLVGAAGIYLLTLTSQGNGCTAIDSVAVTEIPDPEFDLVVEQPDCQVSVGNIAVVQISGGISPFSASLDGGLYFQNALEFNNLSPGDYQIVIQDANGCTATQTTELSAPVLPLIELDASVDIFLGDSVILNPVVTPNDVASWEWSPAEGLSCSDCAEPVARLLRSQVFTLTITDPNGCTATATTRIRVDRRRQIYAPNVFSPDEDGHNDWFAIFGRGVAEVKSLMVYDRWGSLVWSREHWPVNQESEGWDGRIRGLAAAPGVYVWQAQITFVDGQTEVFAGDVTVLRE